jgi:hypothetical protein
MILLYEDETHIRDDQALHATRNPVGKQKHIPTHGHHAKVSLFGAVNALNGELFCMESLFCNAETFLQFLNYLTDENPDKHLVIVLDNTRIHHAKLIQPFLKQHEDRLTLFVSPALLSKFEPVGTHLEVAQGKCDGQSVSRFTKRNPGFGSLISRASCLFSREGVTKNRCGSDVERLN